jgi:ubiquinone/menaquinone biosynthesis C-methylase UbiE
MEKEKETERVTLEATTKGTYSTHLKRYEFASKYCEEKDVLDAACGTGYGTFYLSDMARSVIGLDIDRQAIDYANEHYKRDNINFVRMDISKEIKFPDKYFDTVCSIETIEHLPGIDTYIREVARVLKEGGKYIVSTPYVKKTNLRPTRSCHHAEYSMKDLGKILEGHFRNIEFYGERRTGNRAYKVLRKLDIFNLRKKLKAGMYKKLCDLTGNTAFRDLSLNDVEIIKNDFYDAFAVMAVCEKKNAHVF